MAESLYSVEMNYGATITLDVKASDEGEALQKARDLAEQAPMSSFSIVEENRARIVSIRTLNGRD